MKLKSSSKIKINSDAKSSRFVIDLKVGSALAEARELRKKNYIVESKLEKLAELDYKRYFNQGKEKARAFIFDLTPGREKTAAAGKSGLKRKNNKLYDRLNQLAFVVLAKLLFIVFKKLLRLLFRLCHGVGWATIFIFRFFYFLMASMIKPLVIIFEHTFLKWSRAIRLSAKEKNLATAETDTLLPASGNSLVNETASAVEQIYDEGENPPLKLSWGVGYLKSALIFAGVLLVMVLPVKALTYYKIVDGAKGRVLGASESAINDLISGGQAAANLDFNRANQSFSLAGNNFINADNQLDEINGWLFTLASVIPNQEIQLAVASKNIVRAGELSASAGKNLSLAAAGLFNYRPESFSEILSNLSAYGNLAIADLTALTDELNQINSAILPEAYQKEFILSKQKTADLNRGLKEFIGLADKLQIILGGGAVKRYLLVFQNNSELRASGGFIGSFALIDFLNGQIKKIETPGGGSYDTDAGLLKKIKSPEPLRLVRPDWHFWDANWWPDWPTSARKLAWFYENSDGATVDGVIGLTPTVMERILAVIGPIDLTEQYGVILDADNFWRVTQEFAEQKPDVSREPKKIIGDLLNKIIEELPKRLDKTSLIALIKTAEESLGDKNILFYFTDSELEAKAASLDWDGRVKETAGDYLSVINTNIAGAKTDRRIKQQISHQAEIMPDGTVIDNLTIKRTHEGIKYEPFSGVRNVDWMRIYVPLGSKLISAQGFRPVDKIFFKAAEESWQDDPDVLRWEAKAETDELSGTKIYQELNKTVFANWSQVDPGESIEIKIKYQLPFKITDKKSDSDQTYLDELIGKISSYLDPEQKSLYSYSFLAQKQPGMNNSEITSELKLSGNLKPVYKFPGDLSLKENGWFRSGIFDQDILSAVLIEME